VDFSQPPRYNDIRNIPQRTTSSEVTSKPSAIKKETSKGAQQVSGKDLPGLSTSKIKVDGKPVYQPAGKPITQVDIDEGCLAQVLRRIILMI
jgi:pre-mRNA 3'-end-processing factor FIP1